MTTATPHLDRMRTLHAAVVPCHGGRALMVIGPHEAHAYASRHSEPLLVELVACSIVRRSLAEAKRRAA